MWLRNSFLRSYYHIPNDGGALKPDAISDANILNLCDCIEYPRRIKYILAFCWSIQDFLTHSNLPVHLSIYSSDVYRYVLEIFWWMKPCFKSRPKNAVKMNWIRPRFRSLFIQHPIWKGPKKIAIRGIP